jgi:hypothetical protein
VAVTTVIGTKPHGKRKNSALTATRRLPMTMRIVSPSRQKDKRPKGWGTKHGNWQGPGSQDNDAALQDWISNNKPPNLSMLTPVRSYWTPLACQVEELDNPPPPLHHLLSIHCCYQSLHPKTLTLKFKLYLFICKISTCLKHARK